MGSLITRALIMMVGYAYPAYKCFKCLESNKPDLDQLRFWCQYWIILAIVAVFERIGDTFVSWLPFYNEAKLAFIVYLWYPQTLGTTYIYSTFLRPLVLENEDNIDEHLNAMSNKASDSLAYYWQEAMEYAQSRALEIFQYAASTKQAMDKK